MGGSQGKRYAVGCLPRRRVVRHQVRGQRSLGILSRRRRADFTSSTALRPWKSSATTGRPSLSRSAPEILAVNPQGARHRFHSSEVVTLTTATPSPSEVIELDVDDPRTVECKPA